MKGDSSGNSTTPETTGSGRARGKRPEMEINFQRSAKKAIFLSEKNSFFGLCAPYFREFHSLIKINTIAKAITIAKNHIGRLPNAINSTSVCEFNMEKLFYQI